MKHIYQILVITAAIAISSCTSSRYYQGNPDQYSETNPDQYSQNYDQQPTITYQQFYNDLSPYGNWVYYGDYGYVWQPGISDFRPYSSNGHWAYTDYGWTWVSDYSWGWAPFHYGRWIDDMNYGWMWVPGYQWAPAWVSWRGGGNYYGWAPLAPGMDANISIGSIPENYWTFVPDRYISSSRINNYYVNRSRNVNIINNTTIINNYYNGNGGNDARNYNRYSQGPSATQVEQSTGTRVRRYNLVAANSPQNSQISNNSIRVFRPVVNQQTSSTENARPSKVMDINQIRTTSGNAQPNNTNNVNRQSAAPVREFPKNQTPQINRNEPQVNDLPSVTPERNSTPARVFPRQSNEQPAPTNPVPQTNNPLPQANNQPVNQPAVNPVRNNTQVRAFPNQRQFSRNNEQGIVPTPTEPARKDQRLNVPSQNNSGTNPTQPVRQFNPRMMPSYPNNQQGNQRQVERKQIEPAPQAPHQNTERQDEKPAQNVRDFNH